MNARSKGLVFWAAVGAFAACVVFFGTMLVMLAMKGDTPAKLDLGGPFSLVDYNGEEITEAAFEGQPSLLFFGFTHCPEICPMTVYEIETWFEEIGSDADQVAAFFVTVDPERDNAEVLSDYLRAQTDRVVGITGPLSDVEAMQKSWRVYSKKVPLEDGDYTVDHTALIYLLDDDGAYWGHINYGSGAEEAIRKLRALIDS